MQLLKNTSINKKLMLLVVAAVVVALSLSTGAFIAKDIRSMRTTAVQQLSTLADVIGSNTTAAITFDDSESAAQLLSSLRKQPMIESACVYDANGDVFATYSREKMMRSWPAKAPNLSYNFTPGGHLEVSHPIIAGEGAIGTIHLRASLEEIYADMAGDAMITGFIMIVAFVASYLLASRLQRGISDPILALAQTAQRISAEQDYSIRVERTSNDELGTLYDEFNHMLEQVENSKQQLQAAHGELELRVQDRTRQLVDANAELSKEIVERRRAEKKLEDVHRELVAAARRAGMAEIATGVLHNVGNVLNSVNVSAAMVVDHLRTSKSHRLESVVAMLDEHRDDLGEFLASDEKGKKIPDFLKLFSQNLLEREQQMLAETDSLTSHIEHIKTIVATQQSYTRISGVVEPIDVIALLEDAVGLHCLSFERHSIRVVREYADLPPVLIDKQRLLLIVVNLVKNAKESLIEQSGERIITLRIRIESDRLIIEVSDTGVGIQPNNLTRIFSHGFTTKAAGHGFGLHSSANSAAEMEGSLTAHSDGPMRGATFKVNLPLILAPAAV